MKLFVYKSYYLFIFLIGTVSVCAGTAPAAGPPSPTGKGSAIGPTPPGLAIDDNIYLMICIGLLLGLYFVNKRYIKTKPSI